MLRKNYTKTSKREVRGCLSVNKQTFESSSHTPGLGPGLAEKISPRVQKCLKTGDGMRLKERNSCSCLKNCSRQTIESRCEHCTNVKFETGPFFKVFRTMWFFFNLTNLQCSRYSVKERDAWLKINEKFTSQRPFLAEIVGAQFLCSGA